MPSRNRRRKPDRAQAASIFGNSTDVRCRCRHWTPWSLSAVAIDAQEMVTPAFIYQTPTAEHALTSTSFRLLLGSGTSTCSQRFPAKTTTVAQMSHSQQDPTWKPH